MWLKINAYIFWTLILGIIVSIVTDNDGLSILIWEAIVSSILLNLIVFVNKKRRLSKHYILLGLLELFLFLFLGNSLLRYITSHCLCIIEVYGIPIEFFEPIIVILTFTVYFYFYFKGSSRNERLIGVWIIILYILTFFSGSIKSIYIEKIINTRFNSNTEQSYFKNKEWVYYDLWMGDVLKLNWVDQNSFIGLNGTYGKDKNYVYFMNEVVLMADIKSFAVIDTNDDFKEDFEKFTWKWTRWLGIKNGYAKDKNYVYFYWKKISWADPMTFEIIWNWYSKDAHNKYYRDRLK